MANINIGKNETLPWLSHLGPNITNVSDFVFYLKVSTQNWKSFMDNIENHEFQELAGLMSSQHHLHSA